MARFAVSALLIVTGLYIVCLVVLTLAQRRLMYFPCRATRAELQALAEKSGFKSWHNLQGEEIGWSRTNTEGRARRCILIVHGNAGCAPDRFHYADSFEAIEPMDCFLLEYPGYGARTGAPSQPTILRAAEEALESLPKTCSVFVVGESLGTGVATYLAGKYKDRVRGLFLVAPYNNMSAVAQEHLPLFPVKIMLRDKYPSSVWPAHYRGPMAVLLAGRDEVVPTELGRALFDSYQGPKKLWVESEAGHNEVHRPESKTWREVVEFWNANGGSAR
jgi:pimeloyl-ACP methyl ester carboxylesterase